jgi:hypothetical protein
MTTATPTSEDQPGRRPPRVPHALSRLLPASPVVRALTPVTLVNTFGNGLFYTTSALFFTRFVGMTPTQLGIGLTIAGVCGVIAGPPLGWLADRCDARLVLMFAFAAEGIGMPGYLLAHSFITFLPLVSVLTFFDRGANGVRNALVGNALRSAERTSGRAYLRAVTNVGIGAGAAVAALALQADTRVAYQAMIIADAVTFLAAAALLIPFRSSAGLTAGGGTAGSPSVMRHRARAVGQRPLTDLPYLAITLLNGLLTLQFGLLQVGVPLWVVRSTHAPRLTVSAILVLNTAMVVFLQVRASRGTEDPRYAARVCRRAGVLLAAACAAYGLAHGLPAAAAVVVLLAGGAIHTLAELVSSAAGWALSYDLADQSAHGIYQGIFNSGLSFGLLLAPLAVTTTAIRYGLPGWLALGGVFAVAGAALVPATCWAVSRRRTEEAGARSQEGGHGLRS